MPNSVLLFICCVFVFMRVTYMNDHKYDEVYWFLVGVVSAIVGVLEWKLRK